VRKAAHQVLRIKGGCASASSRRAGALDGLPMGTRPGQLDAGVVLYLMTEKGMSAKDIERFLYKECGLKGLSGSSSDVRSCSQVRTSGRSWPWTFYRIALFTGMLAAAMGGIDGFVFTAGIGENAPTIRQAVMRLGLSIARIIVETYWDKIC
jgi:acetate kinase